MGTWVLYGLRGCRIERVMKMVKSERYPTMNRVRHMLREARRFARYMNPVHTDKRFLMKLRASKLECRAKR